MPIGNGVKRIPAQRVSFSKKKEKDYQWAKDTIDAIITERFDYAYDYWNNPSGYTKDGHKQYKDSDYYRKIVNYRLFNNQVEQSDFQLALDPLDIEGEYKDDVQPYNKAYNKINALLGEEWKRGLNYKSVLVNPEAANEYTREKKELLREYLENERNQQILKVIQKYPELYNEEQIEQLQGLIDQQTLTPEQIEQYMTKNWRQAAALAADEILQVLKKEQNLSAKKNDGFKHTLISGEEFIWIGEENGQPVANLLNPIKVFFHKSSETEYIQDGYYAGYRTRMPVSDVLNLYGEYMTESQKNMFDDERGSGNMYGIRDDFIGKEYDNKGYNESFDWKNRSTESDEEGSYGYGYEDDIEVIHVEWVSQRKVAFITYQDDNGREKVDILSEEFKIPENHQRIRYKTEHKNYRTKYIFTLGDKQVELEWLYIPEVWEGMKIEEEYIKIGPKKQQFRSTINPFKVKLGYHGLVYNAMNAPTISLMDRMKPFQYLYFIVMHKMKQMLAADLPPLVNIDMDMIPKKLTNEEYLYYNKLGLNFYSGSMNSEGGQVQLSGQKGNYELPRSTMQHVANYISILQQIDEQIGDVAGVTRQREGQTNAQESVTGTQTAIVRSSYVTEPLFTAHNKLWEKVLTSLVEVASNLWSENNFSVPYLLDDMTQGVLEIKKDMFLNNEIGVFIADNAKENEALESMRNPDLVQVMIQNGVKPSQVLGLYQATSVEKIKDEWKKIEDIKDQLEQNIRQYEAEAGERQEQMRIEAREDEQAHEMEKLDKEIASKEKVAIIGAMGFAEDKDINDNNVPDVLEIERLRNEREKLRIEDKKVNNDKELKEKELKVKEKDIAAKKAQKKAAK